MNHQFSTWKKIKASNQYKKNLIVRSVVIRAIRDFFTQEGFLEVDTPQLVMNPGTEPYLEVFETTLKTDRGTNVAGYLTTSPELQMKKLLAAGMGSIFQICKSLKKIKNIIKNIVKNNSILNIKFYCP